ncbi:hypothetical protein CBL_10996 [Carabus blaptoides fortunei]
MCLPACSSSGLHAADVTVLCRSVQFFIPPFCKHKDSLAKSSSKILAIPVFAPKAVPLETTHISLLKKTKLVKYSNSPGFLNLAAFEATVKPVLACRLMLHRLHIFVEGQECICTTVMVALQQEDPTWIISKTDM